MILKNYISISLFTFFCYIFTTAFASSVRADTITHREKQFENKEVKVWKTTIEPGQPLKMHRHDKKRVVVALTDIDLTVINNRGQSHKIVMKKETARFLDADKPQELHYDINNSTHPMKVMIIEL